MCVGMCRGGDPVMYHQDSMIEWIERPIKNAKARKEYTSERNLHYFPTYTDNLKRVKVPGKTILKNAQKLNSVIANSLGLYYCNVNGSVAAKLGNVKVVHTNISDEFSSQGRKVVIQHSTIKSVHILPRVEKQVVEISNSTIEKLNIEDPRFTLGISSLDDTLNYISKDGKLIFRFKNVTINHISTLELASNLPLQDAHSTI